MHFKHSKKSLCYIILICVLLMGMCSSNVGGHSVFAPKTTTASHSATAFSDSAIRTQGTGTSSQQAYSRESILRYEVLITPQQTLRRVNTRMGHRTILTLVSANVCTAFAPVLSTAVIRHFYDKITIDQVIITYIHRQDGEKNSFFLF